MNLINYSCEKIVKKTGAFKTVNLLVFGQILLFTTGVADGRSPPYFGPNDRAARTPSQTRLRVETTLDIFLLQLLPFKAQMVLKNVRPQCAKALTPLVDNCYKDYELETRYSIQLRGTAEELKVGCCNLWKYHSCVVDAVERLAHYSIRSCTEDDAKEAEDVLIATESHPRSKLMCSDYHRQSFYCSTFIESSLALTLVLILGFAAILVAALMAGYMFYLSTIRMKIIYIQANANAGYHNDGTELLERKDGAFFKA